MKVIDIFGENRVGSDSAVLCSSAGDKHEAMRNCRRQRANGSGPLHQRVLRSLPPGLLGVLLFSLLTAGCGQKSAGLQESAESPDTQLFEGGMKYLEKNQFIKARLSFQTLINTYPDSEFTPPSFLGIADSYYSEGGTDNLLQAEAQYKDFLIFYPTHEMADDAQLKIAAINYRLMKPYDRDPTYARKTKTELARFLSNFPDSELVPTAKIFVREVDEALARGHHSIGEFYFKRRNPLAAEGRFKEVLDNFPTFSARDVTHYRYARALEMMGRVDEAAVHYSILAAEYPFSQHFEESKEKLILLERPVPLVDEAAAERHFANLKEDEFSLLDPVRGFLQAFTGRPDIYEIARRQADQQSGQTESPPQNNSNR